MRNIGLELLSTDQVIDTIGHDSKRAQQGVTARPGFDAALNAGICGYHQEAGSETAWLLMK